MIQPKKFSDKYDGVDNNTILEDALEDNLSEVTKQIVQPKQKVSNQKIDTQKDYTSEFNLQMGASISQFD